MKSFPHALTHGSGVTMTLDPTRLLLAFKKRQTPKKIEPSLARIGLVLEDARSEDDAELPRPIQEINHTEQRFWVRSASGGPIDDKILTALDQLPDSVGLEWVAPVYQLPNAEGRLGLLCPLPNVLLVRPAGRARATGGALAERLAKLGLKPDANRSKYLGDYLYCVVRDPRKSSAYELQRTLLEEKQLVAEAHFENMPMIVPTAVVPNDTLWAQQWGMTQINAPGGWDITSGANTVVVCVLDQGCDLTHPDLTPFAAPGIRLDTMGPDGSPTGNHGTACGGIVAARFNNALGVAGLAGGCRILPVAFVNWTDAEVAAGINYAAANGASVISMSFGSDAWSHAVIDPAIQNAFNADLVMCVATHNYNGAITYPATNPLVIACGASDQIDNRKSPTSPDGENWWGSDFGPEISVVAPGVLIPTTDRQGAAGYNTAAGVAGDYVMNFNGTSSATPHVAGLAALIRSQYPALTNVQVRNIIERTADKVGVVAYAETAGYPNGTWNQEMGYGRINAFRALDFADVIIRDYPADTGIEPSSAPGGDFWDFSDIVIRITDDNVFVPNDPGKSSNVERGQTNYLYVRVTNNGPRDVRNVVVDARITPYVGLQFVYPTDWTAVDATHVSPTPVTNTFATIPVGGTAMAKFTISSTQVEDLWGWVSSHPWHPCLLAKVVADNDYAFASAALAGGNLVVRRNNLAQRNLSVIDVLAGAEAAFPFVAGHLLNLEREMQIVVDRSKLPKAMPLLLALDEDGRAFPRLDFAGAVLEPGGDYGHGAIVFLDRTRIAVSGCCCRGVLTLEKGSRFDCLPDGKIRKVSIQGGDVVLRGDKRFVEVREAQTVITMEKQPGRLYPLALQATIPAGAQKDQSFMISVSQQGQNGDTVGGAGVVYIVK
jgi:subtilase family protein